jgi:hypothetical protein
VELARSVNPASVITLEEEWGDWLSSQKQNDAAINHYIEAGCTIKAIDAAMADRQCSKAAGLVEFLEPGKAAPYYKRVAQFYEEANNRCDGIWGSRAIHWLTSHAAIWARRLLEAAFSPIEVWHADTRVSHARLLVSCRVCRVDAERYLLAAGTPMDAVDMHMRAGGFKFGMCFASQRAC